MTKQRVARFTSTFFHNGVPLYVKGEDYPLTEDTRRRIVLGDAEEVDEDAPKSAAPIPSPAPAPTATRAPKPPSAKKSAATPAVPPVAPVPPGSNQADGDASQLNTGSNSDASGNGEGSQLDGDAKEQSQTGDGSAETGSGIQMSGQDS